MLSVAALSATAVTMSAIASPLATSIFSPSKHPFMKRVVAAPTHYSFDPYKMVRAQLAAARQSVVATTSFTVVATPVAAAKESVVAAAPVVTTKTLSYRVASVAFKQGAKKFRAPFRLTEGDVVVVEGDRGEHIGTVKAIHPVAETESLIPTVAGKILRRATAADLEALAAKNEKEETALGDISRVAKDVRLNATIADVEYQFDNNKLTIYVERATSTTFVDFRKVQRTLFKMFHCRIWFVYMDELTH